MRARRVGAGRNSHRAGSAGPNFFRIGVVVLALAGFPVAAHLRGRPLAATHHPAPAWLSSETSLAAAQALEAKIQVLSNRSSTPPGPLQPIVIPDLEANSYLKYHGREFLPPGVYEPEVHILSDRVTGGANVDFNELNNATPKTDDWGAKLLAMFFKGRQRVSANGKVTTENGQAKVTIQDVTIGSTAVPDWLVNMLLEYYVQRRYSIDLSKPLDLPDHVTRVELAAGHATFYRGSGRSR